MYKLVLDEVIETTTSDSVPVRNFKNLSVQVICTDRSSGNGVFEVQGSLNGSDWRPLMTITNKANSNSEQLTRVTTLTLNANGNDFMFLDTFVGIKYIRVKLTWTTDGKYSAIVFGNKIAVR